MVLMQNGAPLPLAMAKNACDDTGRTVKHSTTNASLKLTEKNNILIPIDLFS